MTPSTRKLCITLSVYLGGSLAGADGASAAASFFADPGWRHTFNGDQAFYNDPDGPHPDYINGANINEPGGKNNTAALLFPGFVDPGCNPNSGPCAVDNASALWLHSGTQWEGSAPGDPLGVGPTPNSPPTPPPAPGGVGTFTEGSTNFLRIQDAGQPQSWGWADKGAQAGPNTAKQEGSNRRIGFAHPLNRIDDGFEDDAILDNGITISFRARIATAETGPLDMVYFEDGPAGGPQPWPAIGVGHPISNNGRGMFMIGQNGPNGPGQLSFSLLNSMAIGGGGVTPVTEQTGQAHITQTGLIMNNRAGTGTGPDTNESTIDTFNIVEIDEMELVEWQEFWITVQALPTPIDDNTHEVNVWHSGAEDPLEPQTFQVILGNENNLGQGDRVGMGLTSGSRGGAFDVDFFSYKPGVFAPELAGLPGDYNGDGVVDAADYTVWRDALGSDQSLLNDPIGGTIGQAQFDQWRDNFGAMAVSGFVLAGSAVPEPTSFLLLAFAALALRGWDVAGASTRSLVST